MMLYIHIFVCNILNKMMFYILILYIKNLFINNLLFDKKKKKNSCDFFGASKSRCMPE